MLNRKQIIVVLLAFMLGLILNDAYGELSSLEIPLSLFQDGVEKDSPGDWIKEDQIKVYNDRIIIDLKDAELVSFTDINSMYPVFDETARGIFKSSKYFWIINISVGDIISYKLDYTDGTIIHRVIKIGNDDKGWYCIVKGDNNHSPDPGKIRFNQIKGVLVAIIYDWIKEDQIKVYNDRIIIDLKDAEWASFTETNSMDPVLDETANAIQIIPKSTDDIHVGDIISYKSEYADGTIIHRVIKIGSDEEGWYCIVKGDNNQGPDPGKIRFNQIKRVLVAIIY